MPMLAILPMLGDGQQDLTQTLLSGAKGLAVLAALVFGGGYVLRPALRIVAETKVSEAFTAAALLVVLGTALLVDAVGMSMALGAFVAGLLLADSEYRHELEADIEPFKGLLLGSVLHVGRHDGEPRPVARAARPDRAARRGPGDGEVRAVVGVGATDAALRRQRTRHGVRAAAGGRVRLRAVLAGSRAIV